MDVNDPTGPHVPSGKIGFAGNKNIFFTDAWWDLRFYNASGEQTWTPEYRSAIKDAAHQLSTSPGSSIEGVFGFLFQFDSIEGSGSVEDAACNGHSDIVLADELPCASAGDVIGCVIRYTDDDDNTRVSEADVFIDTSYIFDMDVPSLGMGGTQSLRMVALHELTHVLGLGHDAIWDNSDQRKINNVMEREYPLGGNFGTDSTVVGGYETGVVHSGVLRLTGAEIYELAQVPGRLVNTTYTNLVMRKFLPEHTADPNGALQVSNPDNAVELWNTDHHEEHDAEWHLPVCSTFSWPIDYYPNETPERGFHPVQAAAITTLPNPGLARVDWYLHSKHSSTGCGANPDLWLGSEWVNPDPANATPGGESLADDPPGGPAILEPGMAYVAGTWPLPDGSVVFKVPQKAAVALNGYYKVCAVISPYGTTATNSMTDDDAVYSEELIKIVLPTPIPSDGVVCGVCSEPGNECPTGTTCSLLDPAVSSTLKVCRI